MKFLLYFLLINIFSVQAAVKNVHDKTLGSQNIQPSQGNLSVADLTSILNRQLVQYYIFY
jgi:hypothetical protein